MAASLAGRPRPDHAGTPRISHPEVLAWAKPSDRRQRIYIATSCPSRVGQEYVVGRRPRTRRNAAQTSVSAVPHAPRPELLGVADGPDVPDPVAGDVECHHRYG